MSIYRIKHVPFDEKAKLVSFLDNHWKKGHALAVSDALLDFQHANAGDKTYNFIAGENLVTGEYDALIGYIPVAQFDDSLAANGDYWGAIWKIREDVHNDEINNVGFFIWKQLFKLPYFQSYGAIGISPIAEQIYTASRMDTGYLNHYFILNERACDFRIARNVDRRHMENRPYNAPTSEYSVTWSDSESLRRLSVKSLYRPYKSIDYMMNKYAGHPIYNYRFLCVRRGNAVIGIWVARLLELNGSRILRVVDVLGELGGNLYGELQAIMAHDNLEYIDFLNYGIDKEVFETMGFSMLDFDGGLVIPNYFEPYEPRNVKIELAYKAKYDNYVMFKGDSDQDRPNIIPNDHE